MKEGIMGFYTLGTAGIVSWAICTDAPKNRVIAQANSLNPTGITSKWVLSKDHFLDGKENPHDCPDNPGHKHYLLEC